MKVHAYFDPPDNIQASDIMYLYFRSTRYFQHALESLVERVCAAQKGKEFLYKRDSQGKLVTRQSRLADPSHGTAIKSFRKVEDQKSKLPHKLWEKNVLNPL